MQMTFPFCKRDSRVFICPLTCYNTFSGKFARKKQRSIPSRSVNPSVIRKTANALLLREPPKHPGTAHSQKCFALLLMLLGCEDSQPSNLAPSNVFRKQAFAAVFGDEAVLRCFLLVFKMFTFYSFSRQTLLIFVRYNAVRKREGDKILIDKQAYSNFHIISAR